MRFATIQVTQSHSLVCFVVARLIREIYYCERDFRAALHTRKRIYVYIDSIWTSQLLMEITGFQLFVRNVQSAGGERPEKDCFTRCNRVTALLGIKYSTYVVNFCRLLLHSHEIDKVSAAPRL